MSRSVPEWIGKHNDQAIPPRVRLRVWDRFHGVCQGPCSRKLMPADKWICDHIVALILGGEHREKNLQVLCDWCSTKKTNLEKAAKSATAKIRQRNLGIKKEPHPNFRPPRKEGFRWNSWKRRFEPMECPAQDREER